MPQNCLLTSSQTTNKVARSMATYNETVLVEFAEELLRQAKWIIAICVAKYAGIATVASLFGLSAYQYFFKITDLPAGPASLFIGLFGALAGAAEGRRRSFELRLEAQKILALIEIEHNTRRSR